MATVTGWSYRPPVDRIEALDLLPVTHAVAIRLVDSGATEETIATALGIPPEAVGPTVEVAQAKLARLLAQRR